ncbi:MAG: hypothetical protein U1C96_08355 [Gallionella sp.]|nr:hypothetical protein [Gallionella sp.]
MKKTPADNPWTWLQSMPDLEALGSAYPQEWEAVQNDLASLFEQAKPEDLKTYLDKAAQQSAASVKAAKLKPGDKKSAEIALTQYVRSRLAHLAVSRCSSAVAANGANGKGRLNLLNAFVAQKLLFAKDFERKPVAMFWFRLLWPLLWQRAALMPLVQPRGIYCFYSRELIAALIGMIASRRCLEIAAGDGTLSRFLQAQGVDIVATDNYGWKHAVQYPADVIKMEAAEALEKYAPQVVLCSWPPSNNDFERRVFNTASVQLYIVISSRHQFASGNWKDYTGQGTFSLAEDKALSRLVLPPELESAVYVFRRK